MHVHACMSQNLDIEAVQKSNSIVESYWQACMPFAPELSVVAMTLLSMAVSEACVERSFSRQKFVEDPLRAHLSDENIEGEMFIYWNFNALSEAVVAFHQPDTIEMDDS